MAQEVIIIRDFSLCQCTVVEWEHKSYTEWVVARGIHIKERPMKGRLLTGEKVLCSWDSGTYCTSKEGAMRIAIEREEEAVKCLKEIYKKPRRRTQTA